LLLARELRLELDDGIPKLPAARALGVSVKALDRWIATGAIPSLRRPGSGRSQVETDSVLDLLEEVTMLREEGVRSGVLARGVERLRETGRLRPKLRPNAAPADLRRRYRESTPAERLRDAAELSYVQTRLGAAGRLARTANEPGRSRIVTS
jgi:DNA-binding transcriptional MerR regulator